VELLEILEKDRLEAIQEGQRVGRKVIVKSVKDETFIKVFDSISDCIKYLNSNISLPLGDKSSTDKFTKTSLYRYIKSGKPYYGYLCQ